MCEESYDRARSGRVTVSGLGRFTDYEFYVVFVNGAGCSRPSEPRRATTGRPGDASMLRFVHCTRTAVYIYFASAAVAVDSSVIIRFVE